MSVRLQAESLILFVKRFSLTILLALLAGGLARLDAAVELSKNLAKNEVRSKHPWKKNIVTTYFWIGQGSTPISPTTNYASAWDTKWTKSYGGMDDPSCRIGFLPSKFAATRNPFYVALPFNDVKYPDLAKRWIPWYKPPARGQRYISQCKGRWIQIRTSNGKSCFAQWEDVGPLRYDHASYVFGNDRPRDFNKAGLDVSPAVRDYLGLTGLDITDWRFVEMEDVPSGPWMTYYEQAILYSVIKQKEMFAAQNIPKKPANSPRVSATN
jgi:hypothetical protein